MSRRALLVTPGYTVIDGCPDSPASAVRATPPDTWARGLGALLDRVAKTVDRDAVLLVDEEAARALKLPSTPEETSTVALDDARAAGWLAGKLHAWTPFYGEGRPRIVLGITSWPGFDRSPLVDPAFHMSTVYRCAMWQELTGHVWQGTPGIAGLNILRATLPTYKVRGSDVKPSQAYRCGPDPSEAYELDFQPEDWSREQTAPFAHGFDATRMYLAAAGVCEKFAPWTLRHTGRINFTAKLSGWWRVKLGPWSHDLIPAPAGPGESERWVTTPTLVLLSELIDAGEHFQDFEVVDSWTGDSRRLFRGWAETLEGAYQGARSIAEAGDPFGVDDDARAVMAAVKLTYKESWGLLNPQQVSSSIIRPDWHHAILAQARSNLWRKLWAVGRAEDRWPIEIKVDNAWYESESADPEEARPAGLPAVNGKGLDDTLGTFKVKGTREKGKA